MAAKKKTAVRKKIVDKVQADRSTTSQKIDLFIAEYLKDFNATRAAKAAGYSVRTAYSQGQRLLKKVEVQKRIQKAKQERIERTQIDADYVLTTLGNWLHADPCDIIDEDTGAFKRIHDWPVVWRQMLSAADVKEIFEWQKSGNKKTKEKIGELVKFKFINKEKTIELIGKHIAVGAFSDKVDHNHSGEVDHHYTVEVVESK